MRDALPPSARLVNIHTCATPSSRNSRAVEVVAHLVDDMVFDPLPAGGLGDSCVLEADSPIFGQGLNAWRLVYLVAAVCTAMTALASGGIITAQSPIGAPNLGALLDADNETFFVVWPTSTPRHARWALPRSQCW